MLPARRLLVAVYALHARATHTLHCDILDEDEALLVVEVEAVLVLDVVHPRVDGAEAGICSDLAQKSSVGDS